ncbi:hypothetical protein EG328_000729 [Venturia inaequalis]|uniref:Exonuclease domain-containing protein n=1 Tax=Venturia inaequalis TaxID=5025 RepID=A0A8H3UZN6_VENIN|nr:hypothetical protein EG328_000729 [Venturia inaequalis]
MASDSHRHDANLPSASNNDYHKQYLQTLQGLVHDADMLLKQGYLVEPLTTSDFEGMKRCSGCNKLMRKFLRPFRYPKNVSATELNPSSKDAQESKEPELRCKFHPGTPVNKVWTCCRQHVTSDPCSGLPDHIAAHYPRDDQIEKIHQCHDTPKLKFGKNRKVCEAVAIDCEMGTSKSGDSELIRVTMINYLTGATLVDSLVWPDAELRHPNTQYSGVTWAQLHHARNTRTCIFGVENARKAVWNFVGPETIVVGHGLHNDLRSLRWIHRTVVDSFILGWIEQTPMREAKEAAVRVEVEKQRQIKAKALDEKKKAEKAAKEQAEKDKAEGKPVIVAADLIPSKPATPIPTKNATSQKQSVKSKSRGSGDLSLKTLTLVKLGREIQNAAKKGHCSLEDAIATRDIVHWYITNPSVLGEELEKLIIAKTKPRITSPKKRETENFKDTGLVVGAVEVTSLLD